MPSATFTDSRYRLDYTVSLVRQEIDNNRSLVRTVLTIVKTGSSYAWSNNTSSYGTGAPGGQGGTFTYNFGNYSSLTLVNREDWVGHNADGTKSFSTSAWVSADSPVGSASIGAFTVTLPTIPRATTPNLAGGGGFTTGEAKTINLPRASGSFTHDVSWKIGSKSGTIATGAGTSTSWTPSHNVMTELPNAASGTVEITVVTKNGSTVIGTKKVNYTITAGASVVPTVSGVSWDDDNTTVKSNIGAFVQGISLVKGTVSATGVHGSTITQKRILMGGQTFTEGTAFIVNGSGTVTAQGEATDSRGRVATANSSFTVLPYLPPQIGANGWQVRRANSSNVADDNGQYLRIDLHVIASSLKPASTEKNALTIQVRTKASDGGWVNRNTISPGLTHNTAFQVSGGAVFSTTKSYEVEITISDKTSAPPVVLRTRVGTAVVTVDLRDNRVGIGKMHEFGTLDVAGDGHFSGDGYFGGDVYSGGTTDDDKLVKYGELPSSLPAGSIVAWSSNTIPSGWLLCDGQAVSRTTYSDLFAVIGTQFGSGNGTTTFNVPDLRGRAPVGRSVADVEFDSLGKKFGAKTHTLTVAEMPSHSHRQQVTAPTGPGPGIRTSWTGDAASYAYDQGIDTWATGGGQAHNNIQPSVAVNYIIKTSGGIGEIGNTVESILLDRVAGLETIRSTYSHYRFNSSSITMATGWTVFTTGSLWTPVGTPMSTWNNGIVIPRTGLYHFEATVLVPTTTAALHLVVKLNDTSSSMSGAIAGNVSNTNTTTSEAIVSGYYYLGAGDVLTLALYTTANSGARLFNPWGTTFTARLVDGA